jgi:dienelactone hydrolase
MAQHIHGQPSLQNEREIAMISDLPIEHFEHWRDRYGWVAGAILIITILAVMIRRYRLAWPPRIFHLVGFAVGLGIGGLLFIPAVPRIVTALRLLLIARPPMETFGPFPVAAADIALPSSAPADPTILVRIWYPTTKSPLAETKPPVATVPLFCSNIFEQMRLSDSGKQYSLLLYAPKNGGGRDDNASTAAELASRGYIVVAIDDIDLDLRPPNSTMEMPPSLIFDYSSADAHKVFLQNGDRKVRREAEKALTALDRLTVCARANWRARVSFKQVGFFGFSFGGAVAAEASILDPRVAAAANLDGALFGHAAAGALDKPYMVLLVNNDQFPEPRQLQSSEPSERIQAAFDERDLGVEARLANQPVGFGFRIRTSYHENLSDQIFNRSFFKTWLAVNPYRVKSIRDAYLLAFFDSYLRGIPAPLLTQSPSPFHEVEILKANQYWLNEAAKSPVEASVSPK